MKVGGARKRSERRRRDELIQVRVDNLELEAITSHASSSGLSNAEFLRRLGTGHIPASRIDQMTVRELCKVAGDLGRLGGLLKLWISEKRIEEKGLSDEIDIRSIDHLWQDISVTYAALKAKVEEL